MVNTRRRTISTNRREAPMMPLTDTSNQRSAGCSATNKNSSTSTTAATKTRKSRVSMIPRMSGSSDNNVKKGGRNSLTPGKMTTRYNSRKSMSALSSNPHSPFHPSSSSSSSSSSRLSSIPPPNNNNTIRNDTRPISDKTYFNNCIRSVHAFLETHNYPHPIKLKDLAKPSGRDFHHIMVFLLSKIDTSFADIHSSISGGGGNGVGKSNSTTTAKHKFEDDVANMFKTLGYPFNISKTALVAAGSPHTWPSLLLAITWLIELLDSIPAQDTYEEDIFAIDQRYWNHHHNNDSNDVKQERFHAYIYSNHPNELLPLSNNQSIIQELDTMEQRIKIVTQRFLERSYQSFLFGNDDLYDAMENQLVEYVEKDYECIVNAVDRTTNENVVLIDQVRDVEQDCHDLPQGQSRLEELAKGLEDFHVLVETLQQHKKEVTSKVTSFESDLQQKMEEIQQTEDRITRLQHRIDNQTYTKEDVYQLEREKAQMEENIAQTLGRRQEYESMILNGELDLKRELERLERLAVPFNREMEKLELLEGHTECTNTQIMVQKNQVRENDQRVLLGQVDLKHEINPTLTKMNEAYINDTTQIKSNLFETMEKQMKGEEEIRNLKDNMETITEEIDRVQEAFTAEQQEHAEEISTIEKEIEIREDKVSILKDPLAIDTVMSKYESQINDLNSLIKKHQQGNLNRKQAVLNELNKAMSICSEYKSYRENELSSVQKYLKNRPRYEFAVSNEEMDLLSS